jgi:hypothetical protein
VEPAGATLSPERLRIVAVEALDRHGFKGARVWAISREVPDQGLTEHWIAATYERTGAAFTLVMVGDPPDWQVLEHLEGWPVPDF